MSVIAKTCLTVGDLRDLLAEVSPDVPLIFRYDVDDSEDVIVALHWTGRPSNAHCVTIHPSGEDE